MRAVIINWCSPDLSDLWPVLKEDGYILVFDSEEEAMVYAEKNLDGYCRVITIP